jgi:hypothetical protein
MGTFLSFTFVACVALQWISAGAAEWEREVAAYKLCRCWFGFGTGLGRGCVGVGTVSSRTNTVERAIQHLLNTDGYRLLFAG